MKKKYIISIIIIAFFTSLIITINVVKENKAREAKEQVETSDKIKDEDNYTQQYEPKIEPVISKEEKISTNSQLILKKYFKKCDHTINEYVEMPQELVNLTKEEAQKQYLEWKIIGFEPNKVTLYKEFDDICGEHFKLKIEDEKIVIYQIDKEEKPILYEKTNISSEYLTETDLITIENGGLNIYGKEELNKLIEDFE